MPRLSGWKLARNKLSRTFEFQDFVQSLSFVNSLVAYFETVDHHPDVPIATGEVTFELTRYDLGGKVTDRDVEVAKKISSVYRSRGIIGVRQPGTSVPAVGGGSSATLAILKRTRRNSALFENHVSWRGSRLCRQRGGRAQGSRQSPVHSIGLMTTCRRSVSVQEIPRNRFSLTSDTGGRSASSSRSGLRAGAAG